MMQAQSSAAISWTLKALETEMFTKGLPCRVTSTIDALSAGRVTANSISWRAEIWGAKCTVPLLPDQFAIALGKRGNTLLVIPICCQL